MRRVFLCTMVLVGAFSAGVWTARSPLWRYAEVFQSAPAADVLKQIKDNSQRTHNELTKAAVELLNEPCNLNRSTADSENFGVLNARVEEITLKLEAAQRRIENGQR